MTRTLDNTQLDIRCPGHRGEEVGSRARAHAQLDVHRARRGDRSAAGERPPKSAARQHARRTTPRRRHLVPDETPIHDASLFQDLLSARISGGIEPVPGFTRESGQAVRVHIGRNTERAQQREAASRRGSYINPYPRLAALVVDSGTGCRDEASELREPATEPLGIDARKLAARLVREAHAGCHPSSASSRSL